MLRNVCAALARQGFIVNAAIASTPVCARTMARAVQSCIVPDGEEARAVSSLPVFALGADDAITRGLRRAGLKTIGDVAARAPHEITARFGAAFTNLLQQALGQTDAPISPRKPLPDFMVEKRFPEPVATDTVIAGILSGLAQMLVAAMDRQGKGARRLEASFFRTDGAVRAITVDAGRPVTRVNVIDRLFRERLDALADPLDPGFGIRSYSFVGQPPRDRGAGAARFRHPRAGQRRGGGARGSPCRASRRQARRGASAAGHAYSGTHGAGRAGAAASRFCISCGVARARGIGAAAASVAAVRAAGGDRRAVRDGARWTATPFSHGGARPMPWCGWKAPSALRWSGGSARRRR